MCILKPIHRNGFGEIDPLLGVTFAFLGGYSKDLERDQS
jgi:hypothetical protein